MQSSFDPTAVDWAWRSFGGPMMLVSEGHGAKVILSSGKAKIDTRGDDGVLRPLQDSDPVAMLIAKAPQLQRVVDRVTDDVVAVIRKGLVAIAERDDDPPEATLHLINDLLRDFQHARSLTAQRKADARPVT